MEITPNLPFVTKFTFPKKEERSIGTLREKYSIRIPEKLASSLVIRIDLLSQIEPFTVTILVEKESLDPKGEKIYRQRRDVETFREPLSPLSNEYQKVVQFPKDHHDFVCDTIIIDCNADQTDAVMNITVFEKA